MTVARRIVSVLRIGGLAILLLIVVMIALNAFDRPLSAETRALLQRPLPDVADDDNLLHALIGLEIVSADPAENARFGRIGTRLRAQWLRDHASAASDEIFTINPGDTDRQLRLAGDNPPLCEGNERVAHRCLAGLDGRREALTRQLDDHRELLRRYHALATYKHYSYDLPLSPRGPFVPWSGVLEGQRLAQIEIALQVANGDTASAVENLATDLEFWRRLLNADRGFLIEKMVAAAGYRADLLLTGEILRSTPLTEAEFTHLQALLRPLDANERSIAPALENEFLYQSSFMTMIGKDPSTVLGDSAPTQPLPTRIVNAIGRYFFQPNDSLNQNHAALRNAITRVVPPCATLRQREDAAAVPSLGIVDLIYNPVGNVLTSVGRLAYRGYAERLCDLDGLNRIVGLQLAIHQLAVPASGLGEFIKAAGDDYSDPYTRAPMLPDAAKALRFEAQDSRTRELLPWPI